MKEQFLKYVVPSVVAMWVYSLYTMADGIFVAQGVGEYALAAVNLSMPMINATFAISIMFAIGTSTIASIFIGEGKAEKAKELFTRNGIILFIT